MTTPLRTRTRKYIEQLQHVSKNLRLKYKSEVGGLKGEAHIFAEALRQTREFGYENPGCGYTCAKMAERALNHEQPPAP